MKDFERFMARIDPSQAERIRNLFEHAKQLTDPDEIRLATERLCDAMRAAMAQAIRMPSRN